MDRQYQTFFADSLETWRAWLEANHATKREIWLILSKKNAGRASVSQNDAAEEALCFGWVDSLIKRVDEDSYLLKLTPRTNTAKWSAFNISRVKRLIADGRMRQEGRAKIPEEVLQDGYVAYTEKPAVFEVPGELVEFLAGYPAALKNFNAFPVSAKKVYCGWIMSGKLEETRKKRMAEAVGLLEKNMKMPMK